KSEIEAFEFAAERLDGSGSGGSSGRAAIRGQALDAFGVVRCLSQVFWHHTPPRLSEMRNSAPLHHTPARVAAQILRYPPVRTRLFRLSPVAFGYRLALSQHPRPPSAARTRRVRCGAARRARA